MQHFTGARSVTYQSPKLQNEMLMCAGDRVLEKILREVTEQQSFFSISADEAVDCSNKEQIYHSLYALLIKCDEI